MNRCLTKSRTNLNSLACAARILVKIARFLLIVAAISLLTNPLTQHIWTWDRFLHGGHDFESGVLTILMTLCLVILLAQHCKHSVHMLLAGWRLLALISNGTEKQVAVRCEWTPISPDERGSSPVLDVYTLPLQI